MCRSLLYWNETGEKKILRTKVVGRTFEKTWVHRRIVTNSLKQTKDRSIFASHTRLLWDSKTNKLSLCYVGLFGFIAYQLGLLPALSTIHNVFHIFMLRKYIPNPSQILDDEPLYLEEICRMRKPHSKL